MKFAEQRSKQNVKRDQPFAEVSICPPFPRSALCSLAEVWTFLCSTQFNQAMSLVGPYSNVKRVPDGAATLTYANEARPQISAQYVEIGRHGLLFAATQLRVVRWNGDADGRPQLSCEDVVKPLLRLFASAHRFYGQYGYQGGLLVSTSLQNVNLWAMRFVAPGRVEFNDDPEDFRCHTDLVSAERLVTVDQIRTQAVDVLTGILSDLTWPFWQSAKELPVARIRQDIEPHVR